MARSYLLRLFHSLLSSGLCRAPRPLLFVRAVPWELPPYESYTVLRVHRYNVACMLLS